MVQKATWMVGLLLTALLMVATPVSAQAPCTDDPGDPPSGLVPVPWAQWFIADTMHESCGPINEGIRFVDGATQLVWCLIFGEYC